MIQIQLILFTKQNGFMQLAGLGLGSTGIQTNQMHLLWELVVRTHYHPDKWIMVIQEIYPTQGYRIFRCHGVAYQACDWKKKLKLTANLKKAFFPDFAQKKWLTLLEAQISAYIEVKDHKRLFLVVFGIFVTFFITLLVCKSDLSNMHTYRN